MNPDDLEAQEERAAIMEYDGMLSREEAERLAGEQVKKKQQGDITNPVARAAMEQCRKQLQRK